MISVYISVSKRRPEERDDVFCVVSVAEKRITSKLLLDFYIFSTTVKKKWFVQNTSKHRKLTYVLMRLQLVFVSLKKLDVYCKHAIYVYSAYPLYRILSVISLI